MAGEVVNIYIARKFQFDMQEKQKRVEDAISCTFWACNAVGWNNYWRPTISGTYIKATHYSEFSAASQHRSINRLGSSGGVYAVIAASVTCSIFPLNHSARSWTLADMFFSGSVILSVLDLFGEFIQANFTVDEIINKIKNRDFTDHTAHAAGAAIGLVISCCVHLLACFFGNISVVVWPERKKQRAVEATLVECK